MLAQVRAKVLVLVLVPVPVYNSTSTSTSSRSSSSRSSRDLLEVLVDFLTVSGRSPTATSGPSRRPENKQKQHNQFINMEL